MSNPLATFRKNRNYWMAGLVLLAILAFVVAPAIETASQAFRSGGNDSAVVVRWDGGKVTMADLRASTLQHGRLVRFLGALAKKVIDLGGQPSVPGFAYDPQSGQIMGLGIQTSSNEVDVCRTRILASHAKQLGITFSDASADSFLLDFCNGRVTSEEFNEILNDTTDGQLSTFQVRELLKQEMAAMVVAQLAESGVYAQTPGKTWRDFLKLNQTAKVQAFPVFVDDFVSQVKNEPTEAEIQAIYDDGITRAPNPNSAEPGFIRRYQANVEYVQANLQEWVEREKAKLTEEQLRAEYDRRVGLGQLQVPVTPETTPEPPATEPPATEPPATEPPATDPPASEPEQPESAPGKEDQSRLGGNATRLVAYVQQPESPPPVVQPPQLGSATAAGTTPAPAGTSQPPVAAADAEPEMRTQTFEEARERIADSLAREKAIPALDEALTTLLADIMLPYYGNYRQYRAFQESGIDTGEQSELPPKPDLKKLAEDRGLRFSETGMIDGITLARTPFGLSNIRQDETGITGMTANVLMTPQIELFKPMQSSYFDQAALMEGRTPEFLQYIFWKSAERPAYLPELAEVRDEVIEAWKRTRARDLADQAAQELAKKVSTSDEGWQAALSTAEQALVIDTEPFSWMTRFSNQAMVSNVPKLDAVGGEFMKQVFATSVEQVGVAPNESKQVYYVFRVVEKSPAIEELQERFNADPLKSGPLSIGRVESQQMMMSWYQNLEQELGVEWQMQLDQF